MEARVAALEAENEDLRRQLAAARAQLEGHTATDSAGACQQEGNEQRQANVRDGVAGGVGSQGDMRHVMLACGLTTAEVSRYSRHLLVPAVGVSGQRALLGARVLVVGAGGLGASALLYLCAAGVGSITIVDGDVVEESNLQRQVVHTEARVGMGKARSAAVAMQALNSNVKVEVVAERLTEHNAAALMLLRPADAGADVPDEKNGNLKKKNKFDVVLDCVDNAPTRYLLSDMCVLSGTPLVSAAAIQMEGTCTVYNHGNGPCYRCVHPVPPPVETMTSCSDGGVLGVVPGLLGCVQALEAVKVLTGARGVLAQRLLLIDALAGRFNVMKLRGRAPTCVACGETPGIDAGRLPDYAAFCGMAAAAEGACAIDAAQAQAQAQAKANTNGGGGDGDVYRQMECTEYAALPASARDPSASVLIDVREPVQFAITSLPHAVNIPLRTLRRDAAAVLATHAAAGQQVYVVCRRGVDSAEAAALLVAAGAQGGRVCNLRGGLVRWHYDVDGMVPLY